ncbi:unnamed protein product, partial [Discosporangium mesarthrocarpum]
MGVFLSKADTQKFSEDGADDEVIFGVSSMQASGATIGWRRNMEDAHVALLDISTGSPQSSPRRGGEGEDNGGLSAHKIRFFGVFDGHGGKEVALFVSEHLPEELVALEEFKAGDYVEALVRSFHRMDELLEGAMREM